MGTVRRFLAARLTPRIGVDDLALPLDMIMAVTPRGVTAMVIRWGFPRNARGPGFAGLREGCGSELHRTGSTFAHAAVAASTA